MDRTEFRALLWRMWAMAMRAKDWQEAHAIACIAQRHGV